MNARIISAIFRKTMKDMFKNARMLLLFLMFPLMTIGFCYMMPEQKDFFATIFIPMHLILVPSSTVAAIISEEKEKNTLTTLMLANVRPIDYFAGIAIFIFIVCVIGTSLFMFTLDLTGVEILRFYTITVLGVTCSMIVGAIVGLISENQMTANAIVTPIAIILGVIPMFSVFNETLRNITSIIYTQSISNVLTNISEAISIKSLLIMLANFLICNVVFSIVYKIHRLVN